MMRGSSVSSATAVGIAAPRMISRESCRLSSEATFGPAPSEQAMTSPHSLGNLSSQALLSASSGQTVPTLMSSNSATRSAPCTSPAAAMSEPPSSHDDGLDDTNDLAACARLGFGKSERGERDERDSQLSPVFPLDEMSQDMPFPDLCVDLFYY